LISDNIAFVCFYITGATIKEATEISINSNPISNGEIFFFLAR